MIYTTYPTVPHHFTLPTIGCLILGFLIFVSDWKTFDLYINLHKLLQKYKHSTDKKLVRIHRVIIQTFAMLHYTFSWVTWYTLHYLVWHDTLYILLSDMLHYTFIWVIWYTLHSLEWHDTLYILLSYMIHFIFS